jgi:hypothetical protein
MENEEVVEELDVIDTSENNVEETEQQDTKTYSEDEVLARIEEVKAQMKEDNQKAWNKRWGQEKAKMEREFAKQNEAINLFMQQTNTKSVEDLLNYSYEQYGVERPTNQRSQEDEMILGQYDAKSILELDDDFIAEEAERLSHLKRSAREDATFMELGRYLTEKKEKAQLEKEIKESGIDESLLNNQDFKDFRSKFNKETSLADIVNIYSSTQKTPVEKKTKPFSAGSSTGKVIKEETEFFTEDEFMALTAEDLKNPRIYEKAMKSRYNFK